MGWKNIVSGSSDEKSKKKNEQTLLLGIDFGTSRMMVMSNRGLKIAFDSVVGYPRDIIGVKVANQAYVIGSDAIKRRSYMDTVFPLQDGVLKEANERANDAAKLLLKYVIEKAEPQPGDKVCAIVGVPARASMFNKQQLLAITSEVLDLSMVVSEPFMVAYGINSLNNAFVIDIGAGTTDVCSMKGTVPKMDDQSTSIKAGNYVDKVLYRLIMEKYPHVQLSLPLVRQFKEQYAFVGDHGGEVRVSLRKGGKPENCNITNEMRIACETIVPDIVESLQKLIMTFSPEYQEEALNNIVLTGGGAKIKGIEFMIAESMSGYGAINITRVNEPDFGGCIGALKLASELPLEFWAEVGDL